jgi:hypothetical protein
MPPLTHPYAVNAEYTPPPKADGVVTITMSEADAREYLRNTEGSCLDGTIAVRRAINGALGASS